MADAQVSFTGPDFAAGVPFSDLRDGQPLLGHAEGEPVILVRRGSQVSAVGAHCTHYGGPLGDGLVVGDTVRCPWHHACFSLLTGEALGAPALDPVACYSVTRDGESVRVDKRRGEPARRTPARPPKSIVVIGAGAAGAAAIETLRREGYDGPLSLAGAEMPGPVDRPNLSKDYLAGEAREDWIPLRDAAFYRGLDVDFVADDPVLALDLAGRQARLTSGRALSWEALLLATGAEPIRLTIPGAEKAQVHTLRTLADSRAIIARAEAGRRAVIIGSSFIGLEVAASLRSRGLEVDIVAPEAVPLARVLGEQLGAFVRGLHESRGVRFHLGRKPARIHEDRVELDDGNSLAADFVVMGVGVRPRTELAEAAGLPIDKGVRVDAQLRVAPGIFAAGDIARYPDARSGQPIRIEHWVVAERMGQAAARNMLGAGEPFHDVPFFWSMHYDTALRYVGHAEKWDRIEVHGSLEEHDALVAYRQGSRVMAVVTLGRDRAGLEAEAALERKDDAALEAVIRG
jgi:NADPH-dependent 2,4-dienoyl-CoA reductase/sulfur reductase-like enzyme/nitrite reductase/ring-hydroxylating ferredoxin subunit